MKNSVRKLKNKFFRDRDPFSPPPPVRFDRGQFVLTKTFGANSRSTAAVEFRDGKTDGHVDR